MNGKNKLLCVLKTNAVALISTALMGGAMTHRGSLIAMLPRWAHLRSLAEKTVIHTVNGDETVDISLDSGQLIFTADSGSIVYEPEWLVTDIFIYDADHDDEDEVVLNVWKIGSFGEHRPFWKENKTDDRMTEHIFIYDWQTDDPERLRPIWMSSQMPVQGEFLRTEKNNLIITAPDGTVTYWRWETWGLALVKTEDNNA